LSKDEFAVAMYLINKKLAGIEPPQTLPTSLIPPSLREAQPGQQQQGQSQVQRDLFDLFADSPPAVTTTQQTQSQNYFAAPLSADVTGAGQGQAQGTRAHLPGGTESFGRTTFGGFLLLIFWGLRLILSRYGFDGR
jgi:epidermal growth factor receptor substrate 15